jgi:ribosome-binding protein aMBF1 (putative translation factor)
MILKGEIKTPPLSQAARVEARKPMNEEKLQELAKKGWVETTVVEFLDLTPEESAYIELKLALSQSLRERRQELKLSQEQLAERLASSQSRISKMEQGDPTVSIDLLIRSLLSLGTTPEEIGHLFIVK